MAIKDFGKDVKDLAKGAIQLAKKQAKEIKLPELKKPEINVEIIKDKVSGLVGKNHSVTENAKRAETKVVSTESALKVIYYLMAADGEILPGEEEKYCLIGQELDVNFPEKKQRIIEECRNVLGSDDELGEYYDYVQDGVNQALNSSVATEDSYVTPKLLIWDLLTIAYSDSNYGEMEKKLIRTIVRHLGIDKDVFLEMESSLQTLLDLEKELDWIKKTDRPYLTIETIVNEIADRKDAVFESVKDLILL